MKTLTVITLLGFALFNLTAINSVQAQVGTGYTEVILDQPTGYGVPALKSGVQPAGIVEQILVNAFSILFTVGGLGVIIYFIWGAVDWILSGGDKEKISNARKKMTHAIIGLILLSLSFIIINIVGQVVGFNPLGYLEIRGLGTPGSPTINQSPAGQ